MAHVRSLEREERVTPLTLIAYEAIRYSGARAWIRSHRGEFTMEEARRIAPRTGAVPVDTETSPDPSHERPVPG
jgi:hypothetical protein